MPKYRQVKSDERPQCEMAKKDKGQNAERPNTKRRKY